MPTIDEAGAMRLLCGIFAQAARDALAGNDAAARWLSLNDVPPTSWRLVAKVNATPKKVPKRHLQAA